MTGRKPTASYARAMRTTRKSSPAYQVGRANPNQASHGGRPGQPLQGIDPEADQALDEVVLATPLVLVQVIEQGLVIVAGIVSVSPENFRRQNALAPRSRRPALLSFPVVPVSLNRVEHAVGRITQPSLRSLSKICRNGSGRHAPEVNIRGFVSHRPEQFLVVVFFGQL